MLREILLPRDSQPQEAVEANWGDPFAQDLLVGVTSSGQSFGQIPVEITRKAGYALKAGVLGLAVDGSATTPGFSFPFPITNLAACTIVTIAQVPARASPSVSKTFNGHNTGAGPADTGHHAYQYGGGADIYSTVYRYPNYNGASQLYCAGAVPVSGRFVIISTYENGGSHLVYVNGVLIASGAAGAYDANFAFGGSNWDINTTPQGIHVLTSAVYGRALNADECRVLSDNPWRLFAPKPIWVPLSAGGGSGTSISGALGTATASGLQGTVNASRIVSGSLGTATASGLQGTVQNNSTIAGSLGIAGASGFAGGVNASRIIAGGLGVAVASGITGSVSNSSDTTIAASLGVAVASGLASNVSANRSITGALGVAVASGLQGTVSNTTDTVIGGSLGIAIASGLVGSVSASVTVSGSLGVANAIGLKGSVANGTTNDLSLILKILSNRQELNAATGKFTLYDDDGTTVLLESSAWADAGGTVPYSGGTLARLDALM